MVTWHNPQNRISLAIPEQDLFTSVKCVEWLSAKWRKYITLAWSISPKLAFQLGVRFPFRKVRRTLEVVAKTYADIVCDDPDALPFLVTYANVKQNIPELKYLLRWAPCEPPYALQLLHSSYGSHPFVTQYAVRVLKNFNPDTIIFYLPQLVQTLRYDAKGVVLDYLIKASQASPVLAHQLIWNTLTVEESVEGKPLPGMGSLSFCDIATMLRESILSSMSKRAKRLYKDEFNFFNAVTFISELLLPLGGSERRTRLKEELRKIPIRGRLYLPTSPKTTVLAINYERASPMQSAAKVPIMVSFLVTDVAAISDEPEGAPSFSTASGFPHEDEDESVLATVRGERDALAGPSSSGGAGKHIDEALSEIDDDEDHSNANTESASIVENDTHQDTLDDVSHDPSTITSAVDAPPPELVAKLGGLPEDLVVEEEEEGTESDDGSSALGKV